MIYERTFRFSAAHFNSLMAYQIAWKIANKIEVSPEQQFIALHHIHGHNFRVVVTLSGEMGETPWLVDDVALEKKVMEWNGHNVSLHPDFLDMQQRATTENMARELVRKINGILPEGVHVRQVVVYETDDIFARAS
jgi:6-pyruvoyl-tetrahydropterin synthase